MFDFILQLLKQFPEVASVIYCFMIIVAVGCIALVIDEKGRQKEQEKCIGEKEDP